MINHKKKILIKKHLGNNTPEWIINNCIAMLNEFEEIELTEYTKAKNNEVLDFVSKSLQADIRNKLSPLSNLIAMLEDGADDEWLEKQVVECKKSIKYLSNVC